MLINQEIIRSKSRVELIELLVDEMKAGNFAQLSMLTQLAKTQLISPKVKNKLTTITQSLLDYCEEELSKNKKGHALFIQGYVNAALIEKPDFKKAAAFFDEAIGYEHPQAMTFRAHIYEDGLDGHRNIAEAIRLYEDAIRLGNAQAMVNRAKMHVEAEDTEDFPGKPGPKNRPAAIQLYEDAIKLGNAQAMVNRAKMHVEAEDTEDYQAAIRLYEDAIRLGNSKAMFERASWHEVDEDESNPGDYPAAIRLYEDAIKLGNIDAMNARGRMHEEGIGGSVKLNEAARLYRQAHEADMRFDNLSNTWPPVFKYHYAMLQNNVKQAVEIVSQNEALISEFIEFDCKRVTDEPPGEFPFHIINFYEELRAQKPALSTRSAFSVTQALISWETDYNSFVDEIKNYLSHIDINEMNKDFIPTIVKIIVDRFHLAETKDFVNIAAPILSQILHKAKLTKSEHLVSDTQHIALILLKKMYEEESIDVNPYAWSMQKIMLLNWYYEEETDRPNLETLCTQFKDNLEPLINNKQAANTQNHLSLKKRKNAFFPPDSDPESSKRVKIDENHQIRYPLCNS